MNIRIDRKCPNKYRYGKVSIDDSISSMFMGYTRHHFRQAMVINIKKA